jgi:CRP-like cAMP-binding protein
MMAEAEAPMARDQAWIESHPFALRLRQFSPDLDFVTIWKLFDAAVGDFRVGPRRDIFVQGYKNPDCYIVERGFAMRYHLLHDGRRQVLSLVVPGDIVGLAVMFLPASPKTVCSLSEMQVQRLHIDGFLEIASRYPALSVAMMRYLAYQIGLHYDRLIEIGRQSPVERVAHFLLRLHARLQTVGCASETAFDMPLSQEVAGDVLGLSAPHVNRMLHRLRSDGLISMRRRHIELMDIEGLRRLSDFAPAGIAPASPQATGDGPEIDQQRPEQSA